MVSVKLIKNITAQDLAVASARTCYSGNGPIIFNHVSEHGIKSDLHESIRASTLLAGHNTTRQHLYFTFVLDKISRQAIWSFLHSHPFYNSEQVSQRYVQMKKENFHIPQELNETQRELFQTGLDNSFEAYKQLQQMLIPSVEEEYYTRFSARKGKEKYSKDIQKKSQEIARYILPVSAHAYMYHTVSALTLMRMYQCQKLFNVPTEQKAIVSAMVDAIKNYDSSFQKELDLLKSYDLEDTLEFKLHAEIFRDNKNKTNPYQQQFAQEFDMDLGDKRSKLIGYDSNAEENLARAVRSILQVPKEQMTNQQALEYLLNPAYNKLLADTNNVTTFTKFCSCLPMVNYTFMKKLSHSADSQNQRHRMVSETTPIFQLGDKFEVVLPGLIEQNPQIQEYCMQSVGQLESIAAKLRDSGASEEAIQYIAPNAIALRVLEQGNLRDRLHKFRLRLCANAQEEIWRSSVEEALQIKEVHPTIGKFLLPPCGVRYLAQTKPYCPEGDRYCGLPLWQKPIEEYRRGI